MSARIATNSSTYRILIVDDMELIRIGVAQVISSVSRFTICAATGNYTEVAPLIQRYRPNLIIAEPFNGNRDGLTWIKDIAAQFPETKILIVSSSPEMTYAERALRAGASGYWMKSGSADGLLKAISTVLNGEMYVSPQVALLAVHKSADRSLKPVKGVGALSDRELHVFALIGAGHGVGRIAKELGISRKTVETHCEHIKLKLGYPGAEALKRGARELLSSSK
jgi:DNA-binding NarL/FixJ family response regulator